MLDTFRLNTIKEEYSQKYFEETSEGIAWLCSQKSAWGLSWQDIAQVSRELFGTTQKEKYFRDHYGDLAKAAEEVESLDDKLLELRKERVKLSDERTQNSAYIRRMAREETLKEIAATYAESMSTRKLLDIPEIIDEPSKREAILCLSDWHYGIEVDNALNRFNPDICRQRVAKLTSKTLQHCRAYGLRHLNVCNLGDMIAGRIHLTLRLESRSDVITQVMEVSEVIAEMLTRLSAELRVDYYSCTDNHSRLEPKKTDSLELETLSRITDWYLRSRLASNPNIAFHENPFGPDIITLNCRGHNIAAVHGDHDSPTAAATSLARLTKSVYDLVLISHRHHFGADELNETLVIQNSSLMGTDSYAFKYRLSAKPSQNLIIISDENVTESIHRIALD